MGYVKMMCLYFDIISISAYDIIITYKRGHLLAGFMT